LDYSEVKDVTQLVQDFEEHNAVCVVIGFYVVVKDKAPRIVMIAEAFTPATADAARVSLASVELDTFAMNLKHWGAAVTHLLYVLDAKLAWREMRPED
jgi:hypothetical protein